MISILKTFKRDLKPYRFSLWLAIGSMIVMDLIGYAVPIMVSYITDEIYPHIHEDGALKKLLIACGVILASGILRGLFAYVMIRNYWGVAEALVKDLRNRLYEKLQHLDASFYSRSRTGDLMSRVSTDIQRIRNFFAYGLEHRVRIFLISITVFAMMIYQNWRLALVVFTIIPIVYAFIVYFSLRLKKAAMDKHKQNGKLAAFLQEKLSGIRTVKAFGLEKQEERDFDSVNAALREKDIRVAVLQANLSPILMFANGFGSLVILLYGGYQIIQGTMSAGILLSFITFLAIMRFPTMILAFNVTIVSLAEEAATRISEVLEEKDQREINRGTSHESITGKLEFKNVSFGYPGKRPILEDMDFIIEPGERVAVFGLTGSGKSSLISLIPRFYHPVSGKICLDNKSLHEWDLEYLRKNIGTVLQETFLFSTSLRENIAFGRVDASLEEVKHAAEVARVADFIESLPEGYDTIIGEYGAGLSGGQRQRVAIARAILQDPRILILDDCTSSLDAATERKIQEELKVLMKGRTTLIIAQRASSLRLADRIIVLDRGTVQDFDSHENLLEKNRLYRENYEKQASYNVIESS